MENKNNAMGMLDLLTAPSFCVKDNLIIRVNPAAQALQLEPGMALTDLLGSDAPAYAGFSGGCLCLRLTHLDTVWNAAVTRFSDGDVFLLENHTQPELQALALAARELSAPLNNTMLIADKLLDTQDEALRSQLSRLNRGLYQLLRIVGNMSDAGYSPIYTNQALHEMQTVMAEIMEKLRPLTEAAGLTLAYTGLSQPVYTLCDPQQLERAIVNLLSNAMKFSQPGSTIRIQFTVSGNLLRLSMEDQGSGIREDIIRSVFHRYLRQPNIEDSRHGLGLGMVLIRNTAMDHGGTVLIDQPEGSGTRVTLTLAIRQEDGRLRQNILRPVAGGYNSRLIELSQVLPPELYNGNQ